MRTLTLTIEAFDSEMTPDGYGVSIVVEKNSAKGVPTMLTVVENGLISRVEHGMHLVLEQLGIGEASGKTH